ncbi:MAG: DUF1080 domain-containing protein [Bernardetiaceae bacterium]|jgi:hypothetical protein|nr:DUF1080 domain-containing protein [Bernardetiaceae bacterium]
MKKTLLLIGGLCQAGLLAAQDFTKPQTTEFYDPKVKVVTPGAAYGQPPSDALVLFDGKSADQWEAARDKGPVKWKLDNGALTVVGGSGDIQTKQVFGDFQLHIEWQSPQEPETAKGQGRGNSGIFLQGLYEVQVLNSYQNETYSNGQAASLYKQTPPLVNATAKMGDWNTYDIIYIAPRFRRNGSVESPATVTVIHNGVVVQNHTVIQGTTEYIGPPKQPVHGKGPIRLQDHGNAVSYRNIWIREL